MRGIDHLVLCVEDLDAARRRYQAMGFTLTPPARHPFGTGNSLVQLNGSFIELLVLADPAAIPGAEVGRFSFGVFNRDFLANVGEGFSMLVLDSQDWQADRADFSAHGLPLYEPFEFWRKAVLPSGKEESVGFALTFTSHPEMPRAGFFTVQHHAPQHFWKSEYQRHDNGALSLNEVLLVAEDPERYVSFFSAFSGSRDTRVDEGQVSVRTARGAITVMSPKAWTRHFPEAFEPDLAEGPRFAAYVVTVKDLGRAAECVEEAGIAHLHDGGRLEVEPTEAFGTMVVFTGHGHHA
jgi:hypothetical protein